MFGQVPCRPDHWSGGPHCGWVHTRRWHGGKGGQARDTGQPCASAVVAEARLLAPGVSRKAFARRDPSGLRAFLTDVRTVL